MNFLESHTSQIVTSPIMEDNNTFLTGPIYDAPTNQLFLIDDDSDSFDILYNNLLKKMETSINDVQNTQVYHEINNSMTRKDENCFKIIPESEIIINVEKENIFKGKEIEEQEKIFEIKKEEKKTKKNKNKVLNSFKSKKNNESMKSDNKYFPFDEPKGTNIFPFKFISKKYIRKENGGIKKEKKKRKFKCDNIYKKIKSRFHKALKNIINQNLKNAGAQQLFYYIPQCFIENVSKQFNAEYLHLTYKELLSIDFISVMNKQYCDLNYAHNIKVLEYLEKNEEIRKKSGFDLIQNMTYEELIQKYLNSGQFEDSITKLIQENETAEYIRSYINTAKNYINYYRNRDKDSLFVPIDDDDENGAV